MADAIRFETVGEPIDACAELPAEMSLYAATRLAVSTGPGIQAALARVRGAEADTEQARLLPNPILQLGVAPRFGPESAVITLAVSEDLVEILERPLRSSAADRRLRAAVADALTAVLNAVAEVQEQYSDVQAADALLAVLEERRSLLDRLLAVSRARMNAGEVSRLDVTTVEAQRQELEADIAEKRIECNQARLTLARLIGRPGGHTDWQLGPMSPPPLVVFPQRTFVSVALQRRPEVQSQRWELAALGDDAALARFAPWEGATFGGDGERDVTWYAGPAISTPVPIFDTGRARQKKATAAVIEARHKLVATQRQVVEEVRKSYDGFAAMQALLAETRSKLLPLQELRRQQAETAYRAGESDLTTLLVAEEDLQNTRAKLVEFEQKTRASFIHLERAVGGPGVAATMETPATTLPSTAPAATRPAETQLSQTAPTTNATAPAGGHQP
jgi:cobalt-zinc-cadmium efflux system outer membrane protein